MTSDQLMLLTVLFLWLVYCVLYIIKKQYLKDVWNSLKNVIINTYKYSINLLTPLFLITYYSEYLLQRFYIKSFTIKALIERDPHNPFEIILFIAYFVLLVGSIFYWIKKVMNIAQNHIMEIDFKNQPVTITTRFFIFFIFIFFHSIILIPVFTYGLLSNFGNPSI